MSEQEQQQPSRARRRARFAPVAVLVLAVAFAGWGGWSWWSAAHDESIAYAKARAEVLHTGSDEVAELSTVDSEHVGAGMKRWLEATTGPLHTALKQRKPASSKRIKKEGTSAKGKVVSAAVTKLDTHAGTARVIASVSIEVTDRNGKQTTKRNRFRAGLSRTDGGWKLSSLTAIPVSGTE